jgi:hypothetical protein
MPKLRYVGAIDEVDVVGVGTFKRGDTFDVETAAEAKRLLTQPDNFEAVTEKKKG